MITLASDRVAIRIDPRHGAEVLDLIDLRSGRQLLGRPPFASDPPVAGELDETTWTRSYRGGWQLLVPNAGNPCVVDGVEHGFHGRASTSVWETVARTADRTELEWVGHDLRVRREFAVEGGAVRVRSTIDALRDAAFVWVEHIGLGVELLDPGVELAIGAGRAYELSEQTGPPRPPADAPAWPEVRLLDGTLERADRALLATGRSRLYVVANVDEPRLVVRNRDRGQGLEVSWERDWLPHVWVWHEARVTGGPWRELTEMIVVEPASVPHTLGVATAREHGQVHRLSAGQRAQTEIVLRPLLGDER